MLDADAIQQLVAPLSTVTMRVGRYVGSDGQFALVDIGGERFPARFASAGVVPVVNDPVWVETVGNGPERLILMRGIVGPRPGIGVVATIAGDQVRVTTDFGDFTMAYGGAAPTSGDIVGINWSGAPWCVKLSTSPDEPEAPPPTPGGGGHVQTAEFRAVDAGTTHSSGDWWQAEVWAADNNVGAWFYGNQIRDTIPAAAEFVSLQVYIARRQRYGDPPNWALHNLPWKSGVPTFGPSTPWHPAGDGWQTPPDPAGWFNALKAGGSAFGVGLNHGGYNKFASRAQDGATGALKITWRY
jgi:hypothetical protein